MSGNGTRREAELEAFLAAHGTRLRRTAVLLAGGSTADGEDLLADVLAVVWSRWERVRTADAPEAYVRTALARAATSRWRSLSRRRARERAAAEPDRGVEATAAVDAHDEVWPLVAALPPRQRAVLVLSFYEDMPSARSRRCWASPREP